MVSPTFLGQVIITGVLIGGFYAMFAMGLSLAWGVLRIINIAYFSLAIISAYIAYTVSLGFGLDPFLSLAVSIPIFFVAGMALQAFFNKFKVNVFTSLLITFSLFIILENVMIGVWTGDVRRLPTEFAASSFIVGPFYIPVAELLAFVSALMLITATLTIMKRTKFGIAMRAIAEDRETASVYGVNSERLSLLIFGLATAYVAVAGFFISIIYAFSPAQTYLYIGRIFAVTILGGLASLPGALIAGIILGVSEGVASAVFAPSWAPLVAFALLIIILLVKPTGLMGR